MATTGLEARRNFLFALDELKSFLLAENPGRTSNDAWFGQTADASQTHGDNGP